jgi:hypothetical protein
VAFKIADDIIFVMWKYFKQNIFESYDKVKLWSDNCVAQNICWRILFWYEYLVKTKQLKKIVAKIFTVGILLHFVMHFMEVWKLEVTENK